jgi:hypothetical protein
LTILEAHLAVEHCYYINFKRQREFYQSLNASRQARLRFSRPYRSLGAIELGAPGPRAFGPLTRLQDPIWPISGRVKDVLLFSSTTLIDAIHLILEGDDEGWQFNCLDLVRRLPCDIQKSFLADLEAFSARISGQSDLDWDLRSDVKQVLNHVMI